MGKLLGPPRGANSATLWIDPLVLQPRTEGSAASADMPPKWGTLSEPFPTTSLPQRSTPNHLPRNTSPSFSDRRFPSSTKAAQQTEENRKERLNAWHD